MTTEETLALEIHRDRRMRRLMAHLAPSKYVKDLTVLGVGGVSIRITYIYLRTLSSRPDLVASMGSKLIVDVLVVAIVGVLLNRGIDMTEGLLKQFVTAVDRGISRMADSSERTAISAAEGAIAQRDTAAAQRDLATSYQQQTAVMEKVAASGDRQLTEVQTLQTYQVNQSKIHLAKMNDTIRVLHAVAKKVGVVVQEKDEEYPDGNG